MASIFLSCASEEARVIAGGAEQQLLNSQLIQFQERGWLKERGKQRTDSTQVTTLLSAL